MPSGGSEANTLAASARKKAYLELFRKKSGIVSTACKAAGITRHTHYNWIKDDSAFAAAIDEINEELIDYSESQLAKKIQEGNMTAIIFHLKCKGKSRGWVERQELTGPAGGPVTFRVVYEEMKTGEADGS